MPISKPRPYAYNEGRAVAVPTVIESQCNWRNVYFWSQWRLKKTRMEMPSDEKWVPVCTAETSVLLDYQRLSDINTIDLRDWLNTNSFKNYQMFGRFSKTVYPVKVNIDHIGVNFRFGNINDAMYFKLMWS